MPPQWQTLKPFVMWVSLAFLAVALLTGKALAQETDRGGPFDLTGTVVGEDGRPLAGAFVALDESEWGSLTDEAGRFRIADVDQGRVSLTVEQLGYDTLRWEGAVAAGEPVTLRMTPRPVLLKGLHVVSDRFESRRRAVPTTVRWYDRGALASSAQPSALDFVRTRAGVPTVHCRGRWGDDCFIVRGRVIEPTVWIDEAPVIGGLNYLNVIRPHELYMVEVYGGGRQIRAYTTQFMARAATTRLQPFAILY
jgi:hypothetical protein